MRLGFIDVLRAVAPIMAAMAEIQIPGVPVQFRIGPKEYSLTELGNVNSPPSPPSSV